MEAAADVDKATLVTGALTSREFTAGSAENREVAAGGIVHIRTCWIILRYTCWLLVSTK